MARIIIDSGVWFALFDSSDQYHQEAQQLIKYFESPYRIIIPWPCLYEILRTRFVREKNRVARFYDILKKPHVTILPDEVYREKALNDLPSIRNSKGFLFSLVDLVIRFILQDPKVHLDGLLTFNKSDFADICSARNLSLIP